MAAWLDGSRSELSGSAAALVLDHPAFGQVRASMRSEEGQWLWECLDLVETARGAVDLCFDAGPDGPGLAHWVQLATLAAQLDSLTRVAVPMIGAYFTRRLTASIPDDGPAELDWHGARLTGCEGCFEMHYGSKTWPYAMLVVRFERSTPVDVRVED
jgi:hypothetical protein